MLNEHTNYSKIQNYNEHNRRIMNLNCKSTSRIINLLYLYYFMRRFKIIFFLFSKYNYIFIFFLS